MGDPLGRLSVEDLDLPDEGIDAPRARSRRRPTDPLERLRQRTAGSREAAAAEEDPLERLRRRTTLPRAAPIEARPPVAPAAPIDVTAALGSEAEARLAGAEAPPEATAVQPRRKPTPELTAVPEPSRLRRTAQDIAEQVREQWTVPGGAGSQGETLSKRRERIATRMEAGTLELEPGELETLSEARVGHLIGSLVDPTMLVAGAGGERVAMTGLRAAATRGVPLAARLLRLSETPEGASFVRQLVARAVHGLVTGGAVNVPVQTLAAAKEGRVITPREAAGAFAAGTALGPAFEVAGAAAAAPVRALLRGGPKAPAGGPTEPAAPAIERRARPRQPGEGPLERLRRRVGSAIAGEDIDALQREARVDPLTGVANKRADEAATAAALQERAAGARLVRFRLDMDNFKALNDLRGHEAGDQALQAVTQALEAATRTEDLVALSRLGGDEFGLTMQIAEAADPALIRDRLEQTVNAELARRGLHQAGDRQVGASIGFAEATDEATAGTLDALADAAARARKAERAISRPRDAGVQPAPATMPETPITAAIKDQVTRAEDLARVGGPEAARPQLEQIQADVEAARRKGTVTPAQADDLVDAATARAGRPTPAEGAAPAPPAPPPLPEPQPTEPIAPGPPVRGPEGAESLVKNADGSAVRVRYRAVEASELATSHDPDTFAPTPRYPAGIQERRYHADHVAQEEVARVAQQLDPDLVLDRTRRPTEGPPISTADGVVLSGNQRTMAIARAYRSSSPRAAAYRQAVIERAPEFGLDPDQVAQLREPVLTREITDEAVDLTDRPTVAELVARFNDVATKAKDPLADAATRARRLRDAEPALEQLAQTMAPDQTLRDYLATAQGRGFLQELVQRHVLPRPEAARFLDRTGAVTEEGKTAIERMLYAAAIGDPEVVARAPKHVLRKLEHAIPALVRVSRQAGWDLSLALREALDLHAELQASPFRGIPELLDQGTLLERPQGAAGLDLADFLDRAPKSEVTEGFRRYAQLGVEAEQARQTGDLFGYAPPAPSEAFRRVFGSRRLAEEPAIAAAADVGALAPATPLEPGWQPPRTRGGAARIVRAFTAGGQEAGIPRIPGDPTLDVQARSKLVKELAEVLQVPIRVGKIRNKKALGLYKLPSQAIRVRVANDIETIAHEVGHHLQTLLFGAQATTRKGELSRAVLKPWWDELKPLAKGVSDESVTEGLAEFFRRYFTNPAAAYRRAPKFHQFVESRLREEHPDVLDLLWRTRDQYSLWLEGSPRARLRAQISTQDAPRHASIRDTWTKFRTNVIDDLAPVERAVNDLLEGKAPGRIQDDAVALARLTRGAEGLAAEFLDGKAREFATLKPVGKSLREVVAPVRDRLDDFRDYAVALRATELHGRGMETGLAPADVATVLEELDAPLFRQTFADLQTWNRHLLTYLRDAGVISPETLEAVLENNKAYLPFYRVMEDRPAGAVTYRSSRFGHVYSPVKRIKGSGREIIDPFESLVKNAHLYLQIAQRQQVSNALAKLAETRGSGWWIERIPPPMVKKAGVTAEQMLDVFEKRGQGKEFSDFLQQIGFLRPEGEGGALVPSSEMAEEILQVWRPGDWFGEPNVISVLREGKRTWYEVAPELYEALMGLQDEHLQAWVRWLSAPARLLRAGATLAPEFIGRNPIRDQVQSFITSEYGFKPGFDFARGLWHMLRRDEVYGQWRAAGGERASLLALDRKVLRRTFKTAVARQGVPNVIYNPIEMLRAASAAMEDATRIGEFARATRQLGTSKDALLRAAAAAREVSVDFSRHGAKTAAVRNLAAFWNARLQGYDRLVRAFRQHPTRTLGRVFAGITLPSVALYYVNRDDPEYWEIPQWQRDLFWLAKVQGHWLRIPKPFELGVVFGSLPERMLEWWDTRDPKTVSTTLGQFLGTEGGVAGFLHGEPAQVGLGWTPIAWQVLQPAIESIGNYNLFTGRPIVPKSLEGLAPEAQVTPYTSEVAEHLGRFLDVPPAHLDNWLTAWTGGLGRVAADVATTGIRALEAQEGATFGEPATSPRLVDLPGPLDVRDQTPFVRGFTARAPGAMAQSVQAFYDELATAAVAYNTARFYERTEDDAALLRWEDAHGEEIDRYPELRTAADELAGIRAEINGLRRDPALSGDEKGEQLRALEAEMVAIAQDVLGVVSGARGRRSNPATRALGRVGDVLAGAGAGRIHPPDER